MQLHWPFTPRDSKESQQWPQALALLSAGFLSIGGGLHFGWSSPAQLKFLKGEMTFTITKQEAYYLSLISSFAYIIASPLTGYIVDRIGRKYTILIAGLPQAIAWILIATSKNIETLYIAKYISGFGESSLFILMPMYIGEVTEPKVRGFLAVSFSMFLIMGILTINIYGSYTTIQQSAYISLFAPILHFLTFIGMPESPYYYLMKGKVEEARKSLQWLRMMKNVDGELTQIQSDVQKQISEPGTIKDIFRIESNRKGFVILMCLRIFQQLSGVSAMNLYSQMVFHEAGGAINPQNSSIIYVTCQLTSMFFVSFLMDKFGRKRLFTFSCASTAMCLLVESAYFYLKSIGVDVSAFSWLPIIGFLIYVACLSSGLGAIPNVMLGELLSANVKGKALAVLNIFTALSIFGSLRIFQMFEENFGMYSAFLFFSLSCIIGIIYGLKYIPETKGKTLGEIQECLKGKEKC